MKVQNVGLMASMIYFVFTRGWGLGIKVGGTETYSPNWEWADQVDYWESLLEFFIVCGPLSQDIILMLGIFCYTLELLKNFYGT